jgi:hypothetical protein
MGSYYVEYDNCAAAEIYCPAAHLDKDLFNEASADVT